MIRVGKQTRRTIFKPIITFRQKPQLWITVMSELLQIHVAHRRTLKNVHFRTGSERANPQKKKKNTCNVVIIIQNNNTFQRISFTAGLIQHRHRPRLQQKHAEVSQSHSSALMVVASCAISLPLCLFGLNAQIPDWPELYEDIWSV